MIRRPFFLIVFGLLLAVSCVACGSADAEDPAITAQDASTPVLIVASPASEPTPIPTQSANDIYCPTTGWCVCAEIGAELDKDGGADIGAIDALRRVADSEPYQNQRSTEQIISIALKTDGRVTRVLIYNWTTFLNEFSETVHNGDIVCDSNYPVLSSYFSWITTEDHYTVNP